MIDPLSKRIGLAALCCAVLMLSASCARLVNKAGNRLGAQLTAGILSQEDPETVIDGLPAYLLLIDGFLQSDPDNADLLISASRLYAAYSGFFAQESQRRKNLALKAERYADRALCMVDRALCDAYRKPFDEFQAELGASRRDEIMPAIYAFASAAVNVLQADSGDWGRIADLPKIEALLSAVKAMDEGYDAGNPAMYLGVLNCLRPESLGGKPTLGMRYLDEALTVSQGNNQMAKVLKAEYCARLVFDRAMHDTLLESVLSATVNEPRWTLVNVLARRRAQELLESGKDYF